MDLKDIRTEIDAIDRELLALLIKRMDLAESVIQTKIANNLPVLNSQREEEILKSISENTPVPYRPFVLEIYRGILAESKNYQRSRLGSLRTGLTNLCEKPERNLR